MCHVRCTNKLLATYPWFLHTKILPTPRLNVDLAFEILNWNKKNRWTYCKETSNIYSLWNLPVFTKKRPDTFLFLLINPLNFVTQLDQFIKNFNLNFHYCCIRGIWWVKIKKNNIRSKWKIKTSESFPRIT